MVELFVQIVGEALSSGMMLSVGDYGAMMIEGLFEHEGNEGIKQMRQMCFNLVVLKPNRCIP
jgi:hypothetical protein